MKWRVVIMLLTGIAAIYFISLLQDIPYPHPLIIQTNKPKLQKVEGLSQVVLAIHNDYVYKTNIHFKAVYDIKKGSIRGIDPLQTGVQGLVIQSRKRKTDLLKQTPEEEWEICHSHLLEGPISKLSKSPEGTDALQFAVLYHVIQNDTIQHYARIYYFANNTSEYKDVLFPGNTLINAISLEKDMILYSRDPDYHRFRIAYLPKNLILAPHSEHAQPILLDIGQKGDHSKVFVQPRGTVAHIGLLSALYSPDPTTCRVISLDIHKTDTKYLTNVTIVDGKRSQKEDVSWKYREHQYIDKMDIIIDDGVEYFAFADGAHFQHERTVVPMPSPSISRSKNGKTVVFSLIRNNFLTRDFTDKLSTVLNNPRDKRFVYRDDKGDILNEYYHSMQEVDYESQRDIIYDPGDIRGVQLDTEGTLLSVWTDTNSIYIHKRGSLDRPGYVLEGSPHHLEEPSEWVLSMVISAREGHLGSDALIGANLFWELNGTHYFTVAMKNDALNTYSIDKVEQQKAINFISFLRDKWETWLVMAISVVIFSINEYKTYLL